jgi:beta-N-acetylhexosaminidase
LSIVLFIVKNVLRLWGTAVCLAVVLLLRTGSAPALAKSVRQDDAPSPQLIAAQALLDNMSVAERVGQLFLVTFEGDQATQDSDIATLITDYYIGGVVLTASNNNLTGYGNLNNVPVQTAELINNLQNISLLGQPIQLSDGSEVEEDVVPPTPTRVPDTEFTPIPLFVAINHEGDSYPNSAILNGLTEVPSSMALGATWRPELAQRVGEVVGNELANLGVNMLLGPSLDVLENPDPFSPSDLGVRALGGDPYWVGVMGSAYTAGVHLGSDNQIAVIAKHFPGFGASDRPLHEEVPTVRKSLEQLRQIELAPFFAVTGGATSPEAVADGLLTTHIRYQGFQGNIRATTNPVSLDPLALAALLAQDDLSDWRNGGGLTVSDALGVRAVERFYGSEQGFPHRVVAKDAFLAGNDLLYLSDFALGDAPYEEQLANIQDTILWFQERYVTDVAFQQQVDTAVLRILQLKLKLYKNEFSIENILIPIDNSAPIKSEAGSSTIIDVAQNGVTLIAPDPDELAERLLAPPNSNENIVVFTDILSFQQCTICPSQSLIDMTAIEDQMLTLYGPQASAQLQPDQISSYSFADLQAFVDAGPEPIIYNTVPITPTAVPNSTTTPEGNATATTLPTATPPPAFLVQEDLRDADWIIIGMLDQSGEHSQALNNFLAKRPDLVRERRVVVFAFNAPYYLDSTEITQLTALFGLYSHNDAAIDTAVRALFQELPFSGASPVDIAGASYDLFLQTQPSPNQVIDLIPENQEAEDTLTVDEPFAVSVGDTLRLQTGVIMDHNGNPVPDGTVVRFIQRDRVAGLVNIIDEVPTVGGIAELDYVLESRTEGGQFRIVAEAGAATISIEIDISVADSDTGSAQISIITPTPLPSPTEAATITPTASPTVPPTDTPAPTSTTTQTAVPPQEPGIRIELSEFWLLTAVFSGLILSSWAAFSLSQRQHATLEQKIGWPLWAIVGGLLLYIYFVMGLPGTAVLGEVQTGTSFLITLAGGIAGLLIYWLRQKSKHSN